MYQNVPCHVKPQLSVLVCLWVLTCLGASCQFTLCLCSLCKTLSHKKGMLTARWMEEPGTFNQTEPEPKIFHISFYSWWLLNCLRGSVMHVLHKSLYSLTQVKISIPQLTNVERVEAYQPLSPKPYWSEDFWKWKSISMWIPTLILRFIKFTRSCFQWTLGGIHFQII